MRLHVVSQHYTQVFELSKLPLITQDGHYGLTHFGVHFVQSQLGVAAYASLIPTFSLQSIQYDTHLIWVEKHAVQPEKDRTIISAPNPLILPPEFFNRTEQ